MEAKKGQFTTRVDQAYRECSQQTVSGVFQTGEKVVNRFPEQLDSDSRTTQEGLQFFSVKGKIAQYEKCLFFLGMFVYIKNNNRYRAGGIY